MTTRDLNNTAAALLGLLHEGPMTGWDLVAAAQERTGNFWTLTQSQVYRELARMTEPGLITAADPGPRDRKPLHHQQNRPHSVRRLDQQRPLPRPDPRPPTPHQQPRRDNPTGHPPLRYPPRTSRTRQARRTPQPDQPMIAQPPTRSRCRTDALVLGQGAQRRVARS
jgi:hypothetical protein